jgi:NAD(P)H-hydrate epimerase
LVASRYLNEFGYYVEVFIPKRSDKDLYIRLIKQCESYSIPIKETIPKFENFDLILDGIFGFSFKGEIRSPFDNIIEVNKYFNKESRF